MSELSNWVFFALRVDIRSFGTLIGSWGKLWVMKVETYIKASSRTCNAPYMDLGESASAWGHSHRNLGWKLISWTYLLTYLNKKFADSLTCHPVKEIYLFYIYVFWQICLCNTDICLTEMGSAWPLLGASASDSLSLSPVEGKQRRKKWVRWKMWKYTKLDLLILWKVKANLKCLVPNCVLLLRGLSTFDMRVNQHETRVANNKKECVQERTLRPCQKEQQRKQGLLFQCFR